MNKILLRKQIQRNLDTYVSVYCIYKKASFKSIIDYLKVRNIKYCNYSVKGYGKMLVVMLKKVHPITFEGLECLFVRDAKRIVTYDVYEKLLKNGISVYIMYKIYQTVIIVMYGKNGNS